VPSDKDQDEQDKFNGHGIPQFHCRVKDFLEPREYLFGYDVPLNELFHDQAETLVHENLGANEQRQRYEEPDLHFMS